MHPLSASHIDIWRIPLPKTEAYLAQLDWLKEEEIVRYHRFYFARHKRRFAQARLSLKHILALYCDCSPKAIQFQYHPHGKPYIDSAIDLTFNLSHSEDVALAAVGLQHDLGIDVEAFSARPFHGLATQVFSPEEQLYLQNASPALLPMRFFALWSRKESFIKANGMGLSYQTQSINLLPDLIHDPLLQQNWQLHTFFSHPAFAASLCYHPSVQTLHIHDYDPA